ncbi:Uncharacterised protein [Vibrio cholerae]|nr:Uncharacterised protein [Vibrio cholerae]CSC37202.1 Uncharacterised protein [Vibrio cholerae]CSC68492.1 Uncharacterised protein [Vibrio cholerae]
MLSRQNYSINTYDLALVILEGHLRFRIRAQPWQCAIFTNFSLALHQTMRIGDRCWHQHFSFVGCITKHDALVARALLFRIGFINTLVDVWRLFTYGVQYRTRVGIEAHV